MSKAATVGPGCGQTAMRKNGRDRRGRQVHQCRGGRWRCTARSATPVSGDRFPPEVIALAVRWYLRFRLRSADVAALLAERGGRGDPSTVYAWGHECAPLDEEAARPFRHAVGRAWSGAETDTTVAGAPVYVYRASDGHGQVVDVFVSERRAAADAVACFRHAITATGVVPDEVTTAGAAAYPPALAAALPPVAHATGRAVQQRIERDHQHLQGRLRPMRGLKTLVGARVLCAGHACLRNLRGGFYDFGRAGVAAIAPQLPVVQAWAALTGTLLGR